MDKFKKRTKNKYEVKIKLVQLYGSKCYYCDSYFNIRDLTLDHIFPQSKREYSKTNVATCVLACAKCNIKKGSRIISIEDFRKEIMGDKYIPLVEYISLETKEKYIQEKKEKENKRIARQYRRKEEYAHNVVFPTNPIVKQKVSINKLNTKNNMKIICFVKELYRSLISIMNVGIATSGHNYVEQLDGSLKCEVCGYISE